MQKHKLYRCIACLRPIPANAKICSHCGTLQKPSLWSKVVGFLKWVGGIATVISLASAAIQLNSVVSDINAKKRTVESYTAAAENEFRFGDYGNAQLLLKKAVELDPYSDSVQQLQVDFLLHEISQYYFTSWGVQEVSKLRIGLDNKGYPNYCWYHSGVYKKRLQTYFADFHANELLAVAAASSEKSRKADIMAHIAWLNLLTEGKKANEDINNLFMVALRADPDNVFALVMSSAWEAQRPLPSEEKLALALNNFSRVRTPNKSLQLWLYAMQFKILHQIDSPAAFIESIRLAMAPEQKHLFPEVAIDLLSAMVRLISGGQEFDQSGIKQPVSLLLSTFSVNELTEFTKFLYERAISCQPGPCCGPDISIQAKFNYPS